MALARTVVSEGLIDELNRFEELVRPLSSEAVGHAEPVRGLDRRRRRPPRHRLDGRRRGRSPRRARLARGDQARGRRAGRALPRRAGRRVRRGDEGRGRDAAALRRRRVGRPGPGGFDGTLGDGVEALWYDTWMHAEDIRAALGQKPVMSSGFRAASSHVAGSSEGSRGGRARCPKADDDAYAFIMVATGRPTASPLGAGAPLNIYA